MKVYVIEKGYYSDRHIVGVVETKEEAMRVAEAIKDSWDKDSVRWQEYDTNQFTDFRIRYLVSREYNNAWRAEFDAYNLYDEYKESAQMYEDNYVIYADDSQQAIKIAQDMYYEDLAKKEGLV